MTKNREYELTFILDSDEQRMQDGKKIIKEFINENNGKIKTEKDKGVLRLGYKVNKRERGHFYEMAAELPPACMPELDRLVRISDPIMKFLPVVHKEFTVRKRAKSPKAIAAEKAAAERASEHPVPTPQIKPAPPQPVEDKAPTEKASAEKAPVEKAPPAESF